MSRKSQRKPFDSKVERDHGTTGRSRMTHVTVPLPEDLHGSPEELQADVRLAAAIEWYRRGVISQGRAAEVAEVSRADFIDALAARHIPVVQVEPEDLDQELEDA